MYPVNPETNPGIEAARAQARDQQLSYQMSYSPGQGDYDPGLCYAPTASAPPPDTDLGPFADFLTGVGQRIGRVGHGVVYEAAIKPWNGLKATGEALHDDPVGTITAYYVDQFTHGGPVAAPFIEMAQGAAQDVWTPLRKGEYSEAIGRVGGIVIQAFLFKKIGDGVSALRAARAANTATQAGALSVRMISHPGGVVEFFGTSAEGTEIQVIANMTRSGDHVTLSGLHAEGAGANTVGNYALRVMLRQWGKENDVDTITVRGGARTTGPKIGQIHEFTFRVK
jgi:hypothetical protein